MKMSHKFLVLALLTLALSGCSSCPCKKKSPAEAQAPVAAPVQAVETVAAPVVQEAAPAVQEPVQEKIPASVLK